MFQSYQQVCVTIQRVVALLLSAYQATIVHTHTQYKYDNNNNKNNNTPKYRDNATGTKKLLLSNIFVCSLNTFILYYNGFLLCLCVYICGKSVLSGFNKQQMCVPLSKKKKRAVYTGNETTMKIPNQIPFSVQFNFMSYNFLFLLVYIPWI